MALVFTDAINLVRNMLNASSDSYTTNDDELRWPEQAIIDAVRGADGLIFMAIGNTPGHPKRSALLVASANIVHTGLIPEHVGPIGAVLVAAAPPQMLPSFEIKKLRDVILTTTDTGPYFDIIDNRLYYYPGSVATVDIVPPFNDEGMSLQSPQEYYHGIVALALAILFGKEGAETETAAYYKGFGDSVLQWIKEGAQTIAPIVAYQKG